MLTQLTVKNFAIAEHVDVVFQEGMSVLSGETGAGKSIILDALGLTLGDRADTTMVRHNCSKAEVSAVFQTAAHEEAELWLREHDLDDDGECILRRVITSEGRSRAYINGQPCPLQALKTIGELLIDVHSQHEHQSLLNKDNHRHILDSFGQLEPLSREVSEQYVLWHKKERHLTALQSNQSETQARMQLLQFQVEELDKLALQKDETATLEKEQNELSNAELFLRQAHQALAISAEGEDNLLSMLHGAMNTLSHLPSENDKLSEALSLFKEAEIQIEEAGSSLRAFVEQFEVDPERLNNVEERLSAIYQIARKHHCRPEELEDLHSRLQEELSTLNAEQDLDALNEEVESLKARFIATAEQLRQERRTSAEQLIQNISGQLALLEMKGVKFDVAMQPLEEHQINQHGLDNIEFLVSTNAGQPAKALRKVASGGELSRISLAIQVVIAERSAIPTLVFDEVDVGIGGGTAQIVGKLLRELGEKGQIICVTHQPQVASQGHHHYYISKQEENGEVKSSIALLNSDSRAEEIARMLGGIRMTEQTMAHAREMLESSLAD
ncbi:MAG: DNA repair protein RecN [Oleiphilus sp.]|nr:MAG: DNA repair protein RecN [Oleiphilus sp.]